MLTPWPRISYKALLRICKIRVRFIRWQRFFWMYSQIAGIFLAALLGILLLLEMFTPVFHLWGIALVLGLLLAFIPTVRSSKWRLTEEQLITYVDVNFEAKGTFLHAYETNEPELLEKEMRKVVVFPQINWYALTGIWSGLLLAYGISLYAIPTPSVESQVTSVTSATRQIQATEDWLSLLEYHQPHDNQFIEEMDEALWNLEKGTNLPQLFDSNKDLEAIQGKISQKLSNLLGELSVTHQQVNRLMEGVHVLSEKGMPIKNLKELMDASKELMEQLKQGSEQMAGGVENPLNGLQEQIQQQMNQDGDGSTNSNEELASAIDPQVLDDLQSKLRSLDRQLKRNMNRINNALNDRQSPYSDDSGPGNNNPGQGNATRDGKTSKGATNQLLGEAQDLDAGYEMLSYQSNATRLEVITQERFTEKSEQALLDQQGIHGTQFQSGTQTTFKAQRYHPKYQSIINAYFQENAN